MFDKIKADINEILQALNNSATNQQAQGKSQINNLINRLRRVLKMVERIESANMPDDLNKRVDIQENLLTVQKTLDTIKQDLNSQEKQQETQNKPVKKARSIHAKKHSGSKDRLTNGIFGCDDNIRLEDLKRPELVRVRTDNKGKIYVLANIRFEDLPEKMQSKLADRFVRAVCDTVTSLKLAGNTWITPEHIAFAMNGYSRHRKDSGKEFLSQIEEAVEILRHTWCKIDATNEANAKGYNFDEVHFDGPLIPSYGLEVVDINGQRVRAYKVFDTPILYSYASQKGQILTCDIDMLALPERLNMTRENIILQRYLLERIEIMKNPHNSINGRVISYQTIYEVLGKQEATRDDKKRVRERVRAFLEDWKAKAYIKDFNEIVEGRLITGIFIKLFEDESKALNKKS